MSQLSAKHGVHANLIAQWTAKIRKEAVEVFATGHARKARQREDEIRDLHAKMGQLTVERDILAKAFGR